MNTKREYLLKVIAAAFVVMILLSIPLFWARFKSKFVLSALLPTDAKYLHVQTPRLLPEEIENDPNVFDNSHAYAGMRDSDAIFSVLGLPKHFARRLINSEMFFPYVNRNGREKRLLFDKKTGLFSYKYIQTIRTSDNGAKKQKIKKKVKLFIGPAGFSEKPIKLGRFVLPIISSNRRDGLYLYEKKPRRFYKIDFDKQKVLKGPQLAKEDIHQPIQIGLLRKNDSMLSLSWSPPQRKATEKDVQSKKYGRAKVGDSIPTILHHSWQYNNPVEYLYVLDETGRIDLLDKSTLEFVRPAGRLYAPETRDWVEPDDLLAYEVKPIILGENKEFAGTLTATISKDGTSLVVYVFDPNGKTVAANDTWVRPQGKRESTIPSRKAFFFGSAWAPLVSTIKFFAESLHPPILSVVSFFTADSFEATSGMRALFILPDSFIAMLARNIEKSIGAKIWLGFFLILPSIILSVWLAIRVNKGALNIGLSSNARLIWAIFVLGFGLYAYITYRLTRPTITLVTCQNCGRLRRPDMDTCHRCGSKWIVPELVAPAWRVNNGNVKGNPQAGLGAK